MFFKICFNLISGVSLRSSVRCSPSHDFNWQLPPSCRGQPSRGQGTLRHPGKGEEEPGALQVFWPWSRSRPPRQRSRLGSWPRGEGKALWWEQLWEHADCWSHRIWSWLPSQWTLWLTLLNMFRLSFFQLIVSNFGYGLSPLLPKDHQLSVSYWLSALFVNSP